MIAALSAWRPECGHVETRHCSKEGAYHRADDFLTPLVLLTIIGLGLLLFGVAITTDWRGVAAWVQRVNETSNRAADFAWRRGVPRLGLTLGARPKQGSASRRAARWVSYSGRAEVWIEALRALELDFVRINTAADCDLHVVDRPRHCCQMPDSAASKSDSATIHRDAVREPLGATGAAASLPLLRV
jgi:hypothetical protein